MAPNPNTPRIAKSPRLHHNNHVLQNFTCYLYYEYWCRSSCNADAESKHAYGSLVYCCVNDKQYEPVSTWGFSKTADPCRKFEDNACNAHVDAVDRLLPIAKRVYSLSGTGNQSKGHDTQTPC